MSLVIVHPRRILPAFLAVLLLLFFSIECRAAIKTEECLECHDTYKGYSHGKTGCADCHSAITSLPHPDKLPKPACATCHHKTVSSFDEGLHKRKGLECKDCHNTHFPLKEKKFCVSCHADASHETLPSAKKHLAGLPCIACHGKPASTELRVQIEVRDRSVTVPNVDRDGDSSVNKAEWHAFDDLLQTKLKDKYSLRKLYVVSGDAHVIEEKPVPCARCHSIGGYFGRALLQVTGAAHFELQTDPHIFIPELPSGNDFGQTVHGKNGVICADCHISQKRIAEGWSENTGVCVKCHKEVAGVYGSSVHSKKGATHCVDCHNPHRIKAYRELRAEERVAVCSRCHKDYIRKHEWLPNTSLHFDYLECATCHSPLSKKSMVYYLARKTPFGKVPLSYDQLVALYGGDPANVIGGTGDALPADSRIGQLFATLAKRDRSLVIDASIMVTKVYHDYSETRLKEKACVTCHSREAVFYDSIFFVLPKKGSVQYVPVKGTLISTYPIGTFVDFFLLGQDKIRKADIYAFLGAKWTGEAGVAPALGFKLIDFFGLLLMILIFAGIFVHLVLRIAVKKR